MSKRKVKTTISTDLLKNVAKGLAANLARTSKTNKKQLGYPGALNPFQSALSKIRLNEHENLKLSAFLEKAIMAKTIDELGKVVDETLESGIRINAPNEDGFSFSHVSVLKILDSKFIGSKQESIIRKLALNGADFDELDDEKTIEICNKIKMEVEPQVHNRLAKLRQVAENATATGSVENVEIDNQTFHIEFSQNSKVEIAKVVEGARSLGLSNGHLELGSNIIKIGEGELEIKTGENGERNYSDISDNSSFTITFPSSLGELHVRVYQDVKNYDQIQVSVENKELWDDLQETGEIIGNGCLFGGTSVKAAIEKGSFVRSGRWGNPKTTETIKHAEPKSNETILWADKVSGKETSHLER
ncbi:hypothetical protein [Wolbachia endosymbiont of Folsomia candida]|uniref:hypothetical protein n=1 Tax=Wolbachia endosymbiont of Folsomia candida TaxID=169402 RepID=UPI000B091BD7|nr:hypothetical protein [Wolbachia endosymbiont of Folsomia candida]APR99042.1 hypothetical protein ASM33_07625 [Wolbachia endosymbiont of Folsomia candida]